MKKAIIIIVSVLVLLGGTFAGLFFFTDIFDFLKPSNETFQSQAKKIMGMDGKEGLTYEDYSSAVESLKMSKDSSYTANANISMNVSGMDASDEASKKAFEALNSSSINYNFSYDAKSKATAGKIGISSNNEDVLSLSGVLKDKSVYLSSSDIYDKSLKFDLTKLESFLKQNNISYDEKVLKIFTDSLNGSTSNSISPDVIYDLFYISEKDFNSLKDTYGNILSESIDEDKYTTEKNVKVDVYGKEEKTTAYTLTLTAEDLVDILSNYAKAADKDSTSKDLIIEKYSTIKDVIETLSKSYEDLDIDADSLPELTTSNLDSLTNNLTKSMDNLKESAKDVKESFKVTIYSKKNEPVKAEFILLEDEDDKKGKVVFTIELSENKNTYTLDLAELSGDEDDGKLVIVDDFEATETSRKGTVTITAPTEETMSFTYDTIFSDTELKVAFTIVNPEDETNTINFNIHLKDLKSETMNYEYNFGVTEGSKKIDIKMNGSITTGKSDIPEISKDSVDVFSMNKEQLNQLLSDVITSASDKLPSKLSKLGIEISKEQILSLNSAVQPTTPNVEVPNTETPNVEVPNTETPNVETPNTQGNTTNSTKVQELERIRNRALEIQKELSQIQANSSSPEEALQKAQALQKEALELQKQLQQLQ